MTTATNAAVLTNSQFFTVRWQAEYPAFVRVMGALPLDRLSYRPHPRSRSAGELVSVLVQEALAASALVDTSEYHWVEPPASQDLEQTLNAWRRHHTALAHRIANIGETAWLRTARFFEDGHVAIEGPTADVVWLLLFDAIHHRGQLSTYIRPMGGKVPSIYGPSGDALPT